MPTETQQIIADQNDRFRKGDQAIPGQIVMTQGIQALLAGVNSEPLAIFHLVQTFDAFNEDNNPHGERDFGQFDFADQRCFWKVDLYDLDYTYGSEAPSDLSKTRRVLTILLASEW